MKQLISSISLVMGTTIGGGMILLPAVLGIYGYFPAITLLAFVWLANTLIAFIFLEANCYLPRGNSLISMTKKLLGKKASWFSWIIVLSFLYTILCVYISGTADIISNFLPISTSYLSLLAVLAISIPLYFGIHTINYFNRLIILGLFSTFAALILFISPHLNLQLLLNSPQHLPLMAIPIVFTSFGFLVIIPSLRDYLNDDLKKIRIAIILGSLIPLLIYIIWITFVMAVIPATGSNSLQNLLAQSEPIKNMTNILIQEAKNPLIALLIQLFILLAMISSFIGISLGLFDFLADGLNIRKTPVGKLRLLILTFLPPFSITLMYNRLFLTALGFAGLISTVLFGLYPIVLTWSARYVHKLNTHYRVFANPFVFLLLAVFCFVIIGVEVLTLKTSFAR